MKKIKAKLGSFSNDGISSGFINSEFSEIQLNEMRKIIKNDYKNIEIDLKEQLYRLDNYLKKEFGVIFRSEDFVKWFFDKKKINQWGVNLPKIEDSELFYFSKQYLEELDLKYKSLTKKNKGVSEIWVVDKSYLMKLSTYLFENSLIDDTNIFFQLFDIEQSKKKSNWLGTKTLLIYLIEKLKKLKYVNENLSENSFIENSFLINNEIISNIRQSKNNIKANKKENPHNSKLIDSFFS